MKKGATLPFFEEKSKKEKCEGNRTQAPKKNKGVKELNSVVSHVSLFQDKKV